MAKVKVRVVFDKAAHEAALRRGRKQMDAPTSLTHVRYDSAGRALQLTMKSGLCLSVPVAKIAELKKAKPAQLADVKISPLRDTISLSAVDADIYVPGLLSDLLGEMIQREFARAGGKVVSNAKAAAARANGKKGGRPRRKTAA